MNAVILGYGVVGKGIEILTNSLDDISIKYVYVRKEKENLPYFSNNEDMVVQDDIDIVFECLNGLEPANTLIQKALKKGKHVISSNKAVVATYLDTYLELEKEYGGSIQVEACVAGGIPFIDALLKLKRLEPLQGYEGIFNGTSNYILDSMQKNNLDFEDVLKEAVCMDFTWALYIATLLALTGVQLHFIMLSPFIACYTEAFKDQEIHWYTRTYYMGYIGYFLATYLGGAFVVKAFSCVANISYAQAQEATRYMTHLSSGLHQSYMDANRMVLFVVGCIALISLIPILCISEKKSDYQMELTPRLSLKEKMNGTRQLLLNRYSRAYLLYWALISFAMGLFTSYYTVYLNRNLHIDKATSSLMVSISYVAIVLFMFFTSKCTKKFGKVGTIFLTVMASIPFMLMIGNGNYFGKYVVPVVGASLFIRAGLANLSSPVDSALSMDVICKDLRPVYTSVVNFTAGIVSILSGHFTGKILFVHQSGYQQAYFIAAILYAIAGMVLYHGLHTFNHKESEIVLSKGEKR